MIFRILSFFTFVLLLLAGCHGDADTVTVINPGTTAFISNVHFGCQVIEYKPAPGQWVNNSSYNNPIYTLGIPDKKFTSLGGYGGSLTVKMAQPIRDHAGTPDFVVWGNAFYAPSSIRKRWAEPAAIEVSENGTDWYLIGGSIFSTTYKPINNSRGVTFSNTNSLYWPTWANGVSQITLTAYDISTPFLQQFNGSWYTNSPTGTSESLYGFADCSDNVDNRQGDFVNNLWTYDDPLTIGTTNSSGDAIMLEWAVDENGNSVYTSISNKSFYYVRFTTAVHYHHYLFQEISPEIDAIGVIP